MKRVKDLDGELVAVRQLITPLVLPLVQSRVVTAQFTKRSRFLVGPCRGGLHEDGFQATLMGWLGEQYRVDVSPDLAFWRPLVTITNTFGAVQVNDPARTNFQQKFYRAVAMP